MANKPIKVVVLEGHFASLPALGFPLALSLQLQESCLRLTDAMWTAKSTNGGFSVCLFWPAPDLKSGVEVKRKRKRRRRRRAKANKLVTVMNKSSVTVNPELVKPSLTEAACTPGFTPNNAQPDVSTSLLNNSSGKNSPSSTHCDEKNSSQDSENCDRATEQQWEKVKSKKRRNARLPPSWKLRVPVYLRANLETPSEFHHWRIW